MFISSPDYSVSFSFYFSYLAQIVGFLSSESTFYSVLLHLPLRADRKSVNREVDSGVIEIMSIAG